MRVNRESTGRWARYAAVAISVIAAAIAFTRTPAAPARPPLITDGQIALSQPLTIRWQYPSDLTVNLTPATDGQRIYLPLAAGTLIALRATDGQLLWKTDIGGEFSASPVADDRGVYIASETGGAEGPTPRASGALRALGRESGVTLWMRTLPFPLRGSLAMSESALFCGAGDGRVYAVRKGGGEIAWVVQHTSPFASQPVVSAARLFLGSEDGTFLALDQGTGRPVWRYRTRGAVRGRPALVDGVVYFGSADGYVYAVGEADGRLRWRTRTGAGVQAVAGAGGGLVVASLDNFVYFLSLTSGERRWKRQLAGRLAAQPLAAPDGALFTPLSGDAGVVLDLRDGKQLNSLPLGEDHNLAASPITAGDFLLVTTRHGLLAFARPAASNRSRSHED